MRCQEILEAFFFKACYSVKGFWNLFKDSYLKHIWTKQNVKVLASKPELEFIPGTHMLGEEDQSLPKVVFCYLYMHCSMYTPLSAFMHACARIHTSK